MHATIEENLGVAVLDVTPCLSAVSSHGLCYPVAPSMQEAVLKFAHKRLQSRALCSLEQAFQLK